MRASQRERLMRAMTELVGEKGYDATSVPQVAARARVSTKAFYEIFSDKTDCFVALCERLGDDLTAELAPYLAGPDSFDTIRRAIRAYLQWWQDRPLIAQTYLVEPPMAGPVALAERERQYERFGEILREVATRLRANVPDLPPLRDVLVTAAVRSITEIVAAEIRRGRGDRLVELENDLVYLLLRLLADDATARLAFPSSL